MRKLVLAIVLAGAMAVALLSAAHLGAIAEAGGPELKGRPVFVPVENTQALVMFCVPRAVAGTLSETGRFDFTMSAGCPGQ